MSNGLAIESKGFVNFVCCVAVGSRPLIRLLDSTCGWLQEITGQTCLAFFSYEFDTAVLSENLLKPLDNQIYIVKGIAALLDFPEKWTKLSLLEFLQHSFKTVSDSAAALKCLTEFGLVILTPYTTGLGLTKNIFAVAAGLLEIAYQLRNLWRVVQKPVRNEEELKKHKIEWLSHMLMITTQICSVQLNFFGGCKTVFKDTIKSENHMPGVLFNFWGTIASLAMLSYNAIEYLQSPVSE